MSRTLLLALGLSLITGCFSKPDDDDDDDDGGSSASLTEAEFASASAETICGLYAECDPSFFDYFGGDEEGCRAELEGLYLDTVQSAECEYDGEAAAECLDLFEGLTCDELGDTGEDTGTTACDRVCGEPSDTEYDTGW